MHTPHIVVALYAALLALLYVGLSVRTIKLRQRLQVAVGDGGQPLLLRAMRVHANFAEYAPLALLMIFLVEAMGAPIALVHALGLALVLGRCAHAFGVSQAKENFRFRITGMMLTFATLIISALDLLYATVRQQLG